MKQILCWADVYRKRTGAWPTCRSGPIAEAPGETWMAVDMALRQRGRGLRLRSTLYRLLRERRKGFR